jgi:hypothetical protein
MAKNPGQVAKFRAENKLGDVFGYDPYMTKLVAKTEGREWNASDPYGLYAEKAAADKAKFEASPAFRGSTTVSYDCRSSSSRSTAFHKHPHSSTCASHS